ncbi:MAG: hypothetical protein AB7D08_06240 [Bacteroidales bacterium]|jgi:hypothetical protein
MLNDNKISEIKIIIEGLLKDIDNLSETEMVSHIQWEDILLSASLISHKLNTLRIEQERNNMKRYFLKEDALDKLEASDNELKRLNYTIVQLKREIADLRLNISKSAVPEAYTSPNKAVLGQEVTDQVLQDLKEDVQMDVELVNEQDLASAKESGQEMSNAGYPEDENRESFSRETESLGNDIDDMDLDFLLDKRELLEIEEASNLEPAWMIDNPGNKVDDIHQAITLNDKLCFIRELFNGDVDQYRLSIQKVNEMGSFKEALEYTRQAFPHWDEGSNEVYRYYMIVRRRYNG